MRSNVDPIKEMDGDENLEPYLADEYPPIKTGRATTSESSTRQKTELRIWMGLWNRATIRRSDDVKDNRSDLSAADVLLNLARSLGASANSIADT